MAESQAVVKGFKVMAKLKPKKQDELFTREVQISRIFHVREAAEEFARIARGEPEYTETWVREHMGIEKD